MPITHLDSDANRETIQAELESNGSVVIDGMIDKATLEEIKSDMVPHLTPGKDKFAGHHTKRAGLVISRSPTVRDLIMHSKVLNLADHVLSHATSYQLHVAQILAVGPGAEAQMIHRDQWNFDFFPFPSGFETSFSTMWALTDFTAENGATRVVPGSNKLSNDKKFEERDTEPAEMKAGSVLFYTGSTYHGAGSNQSDSVRIGLTIQYSLGWLRQEENNYVGIPKEVLSELPEKLLRLMGYQEGAFSLGFYDNQRDPIAAVRPDLEKKGEDL